MKCARIITFFVSVTVFSFTAFFAPIASAQINPIGENDITVKVSPAIPGPFEKATITIQSFIVNLDKAEVVWTINGKLAPGGIGDKSLEITTGGIGSTTTVVVSIKTTEAGTITKQVIIRPAEIDLLWQVVDGYAPPFYKGKVLPSSESKIKVVAMPNMKTPSGTQIKSNDLVYNWKRNSNSLAADSGFGKNSITFASSYLNPKEDIDVIVSGVSSNTTAQNRITVAPGKPKILFYEQSPLYGTQYQRAFDQVFTMTTAQASLVAEPYFFSVKNPSHPDLAYSWKVNNAAIATPYPKNTLLIEKQEQGGSAKIQLSIESVSKLFQSASKSFFVNL